MSNNKNVVIFENHSVPMNRVNESLETANGVKDYVFEGVCATFNGKNENARFYDRDEYLRHVEYLQKEIEQNSLAGSLDHPDGDEEDETKDIFTPKMKDLSHLITKLWYKPESDEVWIRIKLLDTEWGKDAKACVDAGMPLFISSRSSGFIDKDGRVWLAQIHTYDIVYRPGFGNAKLSPVLESFDGKSSYLSVYSRQKEVVDSTESENTNMEKKTYKLSELTKEDVLSLLFNPSVKGAYDFTSDVIEKLGEFFDYPKFIDYFNENDPMLSDAIVNYFMDCGRYVYDDGTSCENIADFIKIEVGRACDDYFAEIKQTFKDNFGESVQEGDGKADVQRYAQIIEECKKSKKNVLRKIRSINECESVKIIVADYCNDPSCDFTDKFEIAREFFVKYPEYGVVVDDCTMEDVVLIASDMKNDCIYDEIENVEITAKNEIADVKRVVNKLYAQINQDRAEYKQSINSLVRNVNQVLEEYKADIESAFITIDEIRDDVYNIISWIESNNSALDKSEEVAQISKKLDGVTQSFSQKIGEIEASQEAVMSHVDNIESDVSFIAESANRTKQMVKESATARNIEDATSIGSRIDNVIETIKAQAPAFRVFESDGSLYVPNRFAKSYNSLDEDQKTYVKSVFETKNPRSKSEFFSIWESLGL
jgi:hypothetical protein